MKKLRLLVTLACPRKCEGCCNNDPIWKDQIPKLPTYDDKTQYKEVLLTGGEPLLSPELPKICGKMRIEQPSAKLYMYTAGIPGRPELLYQMLFYLDGLCYTIHTKEDIKDFTTLVYLMSIAPIPEHFKQLSLRLNIFKGIEVPNNLTKGWKVKKDMEWIKNCPLPDDEVLMKYSK
jgi:hypothetical protein